MAELTVGQLLALEGNGDGAVLQADVFAPKAKQLARRRPLKATTSTMADSGFCGDGQVE